MTKKEQKKKDREREVRKKILARRQKFRAKVKENSQMDQEANNAVSKQAPIRNKEFTRAQKLRDQEIILQLEHNMKILQALQEEYDKSKND